MTTVPHNRITPFLVTLSFIIILLGLTTTQPQSLSAQVLWSYPSGYDPHGGYVDRLLFIVYPSEDMAEALLALQVGTVYSYDERIPHSAVVELEANPAIEVTSVPGTIYRQFTMNCERFPTNITGYRVALAQALDKPGVVANARGGFAQVMDNPIPLTFAFWTFESQMATHFYAEDIVSANATLDAAHIIDPPNDPNHPHPGWRFYDADMSGSWTTGDKRGDVDAPDGLKIELLASAGYSPAIQACLVQASSMAKCGLQGEVVERDWNALYTCFGPDCNVFYFACFSWRVDLPGDPILLYEMFHSEGGDNWFFYKYNNSAYDYNCTRFMEAPTRLEARAWAWNCCRILMKEMPMIVCYNDENTHAYRTDNWEGYVPQFGVNRMGGNPYTFQRIRLRDNVGGPFGCFPTEYVTVLSEGMDDTNTILTSSGYTQTVLNQIYSKLVRVDPLDPFTDTAPDLAYNWWTNVTTSSGDVQDGVKYTFQLYENITWHDGTQFTAEDVKYSLMTIHRWGRYTADNVANIYRVDTPDEYTVEIYSNNSGYVNFNEVTSVHILPKHIWEPQGANNFTWSPDTPTDLIGTGCFKWVTRVSGQYIILDRFENWHFAVEHPTDRTLCIIVDPIPWGAYIFMLGMVVVIIQVVLLSVLLYRRHTRQGKKGVLKGTMN